jgi:hypothetical protein
MQKFLLRIMWPNKKAFQVKSPIGLEVYFKSFSKENDTQVQACLGIFQPKMEG